MAKERWYTAVAVIALALGIGVNATVFSIVNGAFLRGLPFKEADRLYLLAWDGRNGRIGVSMPELGDWAAQTRTFSGLAAFRNGEMNISDDQAFPEQASGAWVTAQSFGLIGQSPLLGRDFSPRDDDTGAEPVVILGYRLWQNRYGGDRGVIGKPIRLNGQPATIIGVMPDGVRFPNNTDAWAA